MRSVNLIQEVVGSRAATILQQTYGKEFFRRPIIFRTKEELVSTNDVQKCNQNSKTTRETEDAQTQ